MNVLEKKILRSLLRIRLVETEISKKYSEQLMRCPVHLSLGQEGCAVGVCETLSVKDQIYSSHRSHSHYLAKSGDLRAMLCELYGKSSGCCGGRGGSMHLMDKNVGMMLSIPIVASVIPIAVGAALSMKLKRKKQIVVVFFGDAALEEGVYHESANFASVHELPILFVCENNKYSCFTNIKDRQPSEDFTRFAKCHKIKSHRMFGNNVMNIFNFTKTIVSDMKKSPLPFFLQLDTYRNVEHCGPYNDDNLSYRNSQEINYWTRRDPVKLYIESLIKNDKISDIELNKLKEKLNKEISEAFIFAENDDFPKISTLNKFIYAN